MKGFNANQLSKLVYAHPKFKSKGDPKGVGYDSADGDFISN